MNEQDRVPCVTRRERQVATLIAEGLTNRQIAKRLGISAEMVSRYVSNLMNKLNVNSRVQIAVIAERYGWTARDE